MERDIQVFLGRELAPAVGEWMDAEDLPEALEAWNEALKGEPCIADFEGWDFGHEPSPFEVAWVVEFVERVERDGGDTDAAEAYWKWTGRQIGGNAIDAAEDFQDRYEGEHGSWRDFAYHYVDEWGGDEWDFNKHDSFHPSNFIDWDQVVDYLRDSHYEEGGYFFRS